MATLRELSSVMLELLCHIEEAEGELTDEIAAKYEATKEQISGKVDDYANCIAALKGDAETLDAEIKRLTERKRTITNKIDSLKSNLLFNMQVLEMDKVKTDLWQASVRTSKAVSVREDEMNAEVIAEVGAIMEKHPYIDITIKPRKSEMMKDYKDGAELPAWANIVENTNLNLR